MIKALVFDIGGVIVDFQEERYIRYLSKKLNISQNRIRRVLLPLVVTMEYGRMDLDHAEKIIADHFDLRVSDLEWVSAFMKLAKPDRNVIAFVKKLSKTYKIGIITNQSKSRYRELGKLGIGSLVKSGAVSFVAVSAYLGVRKPNPKIYRHTLRKMRVKPSESIFIDDKEENVVGARKVGMLAVRFKNSRQLKSDLRKMSVS